MREINDDIEQHMYMDILFALNDTPKMVHRSTGVHESRISD
jgi:hypothetical protein